MNYRADIAGLRQSNRALLARILELEAENERLRGVLTAVDEWDLTWADGLDANVARIKMMVRAVLEGR